MKLVVFSPQTSAEHLWKGELLLSLTRIFVRKSYKEVFFIFLLLLLYLILQLQFIHPKTTNQARNEGLL